MRSSHYIIPALCMLLLLSCSNKKEGNTGTAVNTTGSDSLYPGIPAAAAAAKLDLLAIADSLPLGFAKDSLAAAVQAAPINCFNIDLKTILAADSTTSFKSLPRVEFPAQVPFISPAKNVVAVVSINSRGGQYAIGQLINYPLAQQLDSIMKLDSATLENITELYAIQARVFVVSRGGTSVYYYGINNQNLSLKPLTNHELMIALKKEAVFFTNKYPGGGEEVYW